MEYTVSYIRIYKKCRGGVRLSHFRENKAAIYKNDAFIYIKNLQFKFVLEFKIIDDVTAQPCHLGEEIPLAILTIRLCFH